MCQYSTSTKTNNLNTLSMLILEITLFVKISQIRYPNSVKFQQIFYDISRLLLHSIWPNFYLDGLDFQFIGSNENSVATTWVASGINYLKC